MFSYLLTEFVILRSCINLLDIPFKLLSNNSSNDKIIFSSLFKNAKSHLFTNLLSTNIIILNASLTSVNCSSKLSKLILANFLPFTI